MQVREIEFFGFMGYTGHQKVSLPPIGLVLVTGPNGAGKSALMEAVSYAGWGESVRGADPRREGEKGATTVTLGSGWALTRHWNAAGKKTLDVELVGTDVHEFESTSKAQEFVEGALGEWDTWRRSCTFSMADDVMFSTATDAERKRLLESLLDLKRFDLAQERCRADAKAAANALAAATQNLTRAQARLDEARRGLTSLKQVAAAAAPAVDREALEARSAALGEQAEAADRALAEANQTFREVQRKVDAHRSEVDRLKRLARTLMSADTCPTCSQPMPDAEHRQAERDRIAGEVAELEKQAPPAPDQAAVAAAQRTLRGLHDQLATVEAQLREADAAAARHARAAEQVRQREAEIAKLETEVEALLADQAEAQHKVSHLSATDAVLGTRGARAHMLTAALAGLEAAANVWLEQIARTDAPLTLKLSSYTEKKTGGTSDAISMEIVGAGGGRGYKAASGGERRRIDVALMLALSDIAQSASGRIASTLFFDEVFDALDTAGVDAVSRALESLSSDRCVVVISHNEELIASLTPDLRLHVEGGEIEAS